MHMEGVEIADSDLSYCTRDEMYRYLFKKRRSPIDSNRVCIQGVGCVRAPVKGCTHRVAEHYHGCIQCTKYLRREDSVIGFYCRISRRSPTA